MTHHRMLERVPSVAITSKRNELKVYEGNIVYLNNGDNFELQFFNPLQEKIGIEIMFNGIKKGDSYLVLNPGQDVILDRFLDEQRKMLFETYVVDGNNKDVVEAIQQNGIITFNFYKEYFNSFNSNQPNVNINYDFPPKHHNRYTKSFNSGTLSRGITGNSGPIGTTGTLNTQSFCNTTTTNNAAYFGSNITYTSSSVTSKWSPIMESDISFASMDMLDLEQSELETGRVEKGEVSNQTLKTINAQFSSTAFHSIIYKMLPYSAKNNTIGEIRMYCTSCGYRLRKENWKFCPKCGEKIN